MCKLSLILFICSMMTISSCDTAKKSTNDSNNNEVLKEVKSNAEKLTAAGFEEMTVVDMKQEDGCGFVLKSTESKQIFTPIEWREEDFKVNGKIVWVKYRTSKITQTTCLKSTPIIIDEIKLPQ